MPTGPVMPELFATRTAQAALEDLRARLRATRWVDAPQDWGWSYGVDVDYLRELVSYWAGEFDWPAREEELGRLPRFRVRLGGLDVHFVHARASVARALPLILCHGWPDSFWRYEKVIPLLVDPAAHGGDASDAFDVVVPDMPGYGYSERPRGAPLDSEAVAGMWAELMSVLGYECFGAAGGDIGGGVVRYLGLDHPQRVAAVHKMEAVSVYTGDRGDLSSQERAWLDEISAWGREEGAYMAMHQTRPQTAAIGLTDSPVGLAGWIVEKLRAWSDCGDDLESVFTKDEILTNVTIYWLTETIGASMRMYRANAAIPPERHARRVEVPSGFSLFPHDLVRPAPRSWLERTANVVYVNEPPRGGHFAPFEQPELYAEELRTFFRPYRSAVT